MLDTLSFLRRITPKTGYKILALPRPAPYKGFKHHVFESHQEMAESVEEWADDGLTVFHACAGFVEQSVTVTKRDRKTGELVEKAAVRIADNAGWARSFWVDLDVGDGKPYATQKAACAALYAACKRAELPYPMLVSSGYGVHAYWPLERDIEASSWTRLAARLKALLTRLEVHQDMTRTADIASVLRPVGACNFKNEDDPRTVRVILDQPDRNPKAFFQAVLTAVEKFNVDVKEAPKKDINASLMSPIEYPPSSAEKVADKCAAMGHFRTVMGNVEEPFWRAALGVLKHTVEGDDVAHQWSQGYDGYDRYETQDKLDRWTAGPATCATFQGFGKCDGCPFASKVKSPIQLGVQLPENIDRARAPAAPVDKPQAAAPAEAPESDEARQEAAPGGEEAVAGVIPALPDSVALTYRFNGNVLLTMVEDDDGVPHPVTICRELIFPLEVTRSAGDAKQNSQAVIRSRRYTPDGRAEEINIPFQAVATGNRDLAAYFGSIGVVVEDIRHMRNYLNSFVNHLREQAADSLAAERMGWNGDEFLLGEARYTPTGLSKGVLSSALKEYQASFGLKGSLEGWVEAVDAAYNRPGQEQYQFMVLAGFAAPLVRFMGDYRGVVVSAVSYSSGQGKTTAQNAAISIYGDPVRLSTAHKRGTVNALFERLGAMGTLPFAIDEVSNIDSQELSDLAYAISQGVQKDRLNKSGALRAQREPWQTLVLVSGNRSLLHTLGADGASRQPEMLRIFEVSFEQVSDLSKADADRIFRDLSKHYGHAGRVYGEFLARYAGKVEALCEKTMQQVNELFSLTREERFWGVVLATTLTGLLLARRLQLVKFETKPLINWLQVQLAEMRANVKSQAGSDADLLATMMTEASYDMLVTDTVGDGRGRPAVIVREPKRPPRVSGRMIRETNELWLRPEWVKAWCNERRADQRRIRAALDESGALRANNDSANIYRGVPGMPPAKGRYWVVDLNALGGVEALEKVVPLRAVQ